MAISAQLVAMLLGPSGPALGMTGPTGPSTEGATGTVGSPGPIGRSGPLGWIGRRGLDSPLTGATGRAGPAQATGYTGPTGPGATGAIIPSSQIVRAVNPGIYGASRYPGLDVGLRISYTVMNAPTALFLLCTGIVENTGPWTTNVTIDYGLGPLPPPGPSNSSGGGLDIACSGLSVPFFLTRLFTISDLDGGDSEQWWFDLAVWSSTPTGTGFPAATANARNVTLILLDMFGAP